MTKKDLVVKVAADTKCGQKLVAEVVEGMMGYISEELASGRSIEIRNFGVFEVKVRKSRKGRNPRKPGNEVVIPERAVVKFRAGKVLREKVESLIK